MPVLPDYSGANVRGIIPALLGPIDPPDWLNVRRNATARVVLVLDGLGWEQFETFKQHAPTLAALHRRSITTIAPSTTAAGLASISTGLPPAEHGLLGYRMAIGGEVLNVLSWRTANGDARKSMEPARIQPFEPFLGERVPVVTNAMFAGSGFTVAHLRGGLFTGWRTPSNLAVRVRAQLDAGQRFVYAYYDGIDKVAHEFGFGDFYDAELGAADAIVAQLIGILPSGVDLVITADHGQVHVGKSLIKPRRDVAALSAFGSGEGRFRWLHAKPGAAADLLAAAAEAHGDVAWVVDRQQVLDERWFGPVISAPVAARLGDVAMVAHQPVSFIDPEEPGHELACRHGSLTSAEMLVPLFTHST